MRHGELARERADQFVGRVAVRLDTRHSRPARQPEAGPRRMSSQPLAPWSCSSVPPLGRSLRRPRSALGWPSSQQRALDTPAMPRPCRRSPARSNMHSSGSRCGAARRPMRGEEHTIAGGRLDRRSLSVDRRRRRRSRRELWRDARQSHAQSLSARGARTPSAVLHSARVPRWWPTSPPTHRSNGGRRSNDGCDGRVLWRPRAQRPAAGVRTVHEYAPDQSDDSLPRRCVDHGATLGDV